MTLPASQKKAMARYQKNSVRWTANAKKDTPRGNLLESAKTDKDFVNKFWSWLENTYK